MASTTSALNSDLPPHQLPFPIPIPSPPLLLPSISTNTTTTTTITAAAAPSMDDFLKNIYGDSSSSSIAADDGGGPMPARAVAMDEVWKEAEMTLEDFLTRAAGAVRDEEMRITAVPSVSALPPPQPPPPPPQCFGGSASVNVTSSMIVGGGGFGVVPRVAVPVGGNGHFQSSLATTEGFGNGGGGGRAKRRAVEEAPVDKATQQKQRRMIKNRESAARSRERKQAYTVDLETMVTQLEEENARLHNEEAEENRERFKQLMQNVIPVTEKQRPPRRLRRVNSMVW